MPELIGLDFETYGAEDLPTHGLVRYSEHKTFQPLIGSVAWKSGSSIKRITYDFVFDRRAATRDVRDATLKHTICAHNAPFEQATLDQLGIKRPSSQFIDSAVVARAAGAGSRLEAAAPQLLGTAKLEEGRSLIKLFSIPGEYQEKSGSPVFDPQVIVDHPNEWKKFIEYCELDAALSLRLVKDYTNWMTDRELEYAAITMDMNRAGWCVDVPLVEEMQRRYQENQVEALNEFRARYFEPDLNLNSLKQLKEWCAKRGVKATSFDEKHVARYLAAIEKKLAAHFDGSGVLSFDKLEGYEAVRDLLVTKQTLGGSSLKKLQVILNTVGNDGRLRDQYVHCGAGQTLRTTGRSTQMQNLKRLTADVKDMTELDDVATVWDNGELAANMRQVFTATDPNGRLIVGDFKSVENVGLAWLAGAKNKVAAFRAGKDMYKVMATSMYPVAYDDVTKEQRQAGKVGELSCGYQAAGPAVQDFAEGMGIKLTEAEAAKIVADWRQANPEILDLWAELDAMLRAVVEGSNNTHIHYLPDGLKLRMFKVDTPATLAKQHPGAQSIAMQVSDAKGMVLMIRYFHGCYVRGNSICYYKPSDRKTGDLWKNHYIHPKSKQVTFFSLYGGKLAGILTQSFCRELFFEALAKVHRWAECHEHLSLVGQFHDEIIIDWKSGAHPLADAKVQLEKLMSNPGFAPSFPLAADIKDDYRYTK